MFFGHFGGQNHDFGSFWRLQAVPDAHFEDFGDSCDFGGTFLRKTIPILTLKWCHEPIFFSFVFFMFLLSAIFSGFL